MVVSHLANTTTNQQRRRHPTPMTSRYRPWLATYAKAFSCRFVFCLTTSCVVLTTHNFAFFSVGVYATAPSRRLYLSDFTDSQSTRRRTFRKFCGRLREVSGRFSRTFDYVRLLEHSGDGPGHCQPYCPSNCW
jgi:hypothetical protein